MKDTKDIKEMWMNSGVIGRVIIGFLVLTIIFMSVFMALIMQSNVQNEKLLNNLSSMIEEGRETIKLKKCILKEYNESTIFFNKDLLMCLGNFMNINNITFPQELNVKIQEYRTKMDKIKDCLIIPEDLK